MEKFQIFIFLSFLFFSQAFEIHKQKSFLIKKHENVNDSNFITIKLKKAEIESKEKHEIFDFVSKSQSYLLNSEEKNMLLSTDHKSSSLSSSFSTSVQKVSLYNFKNTQVLFINFIKSSFL